MNIARFLLVCSALVLLAGCTENRWRAQEAQSYYTSQQQLAATRKPLFELKAQPGQTIQLSGIESLTVNDPREQKVDALPEHRNQLLDSAVKVLSIAAPLVGAKIAADGVTNLVDVVGKNGGDHSVTNITGSYNSQGDTLNGSIKGNVSGNGAGVGNVYHDSSTAIAGNGNAAGTSNNVQNGNDNRQSSSGPTTGGSSNCSGGSGSSGGGDGGTGAGTGAGASGCTGGPAGG